MFKKENFMVFDWFITENLDLVERTKAKTLTALLLFILTISAVLAPISISIGSDFPYVTICFGVIGLLLLFKITKSNLLVGNLFCMFLFVLFSYMSLNTGGVFSRDLGAAVIIPIVAISINGIRSTLFWTVMVVLLNIYFIKISSTAIEISTFKKQMDDFPSVYYLAINLTSLLIPILILMILNRLNKELIRKLTLVNQQLDKSNSQLRVQTDQLEVNASALKDVNSRLEKYAYTISHDLKQPLRTISSYSQLIQKKVKSPEIDRSKLIEYASFITSGTQRIHTKVENLLDIASNKSEAKHTQEKNIEDLLADVIRDLSLQIKESNTLIEIGKMPTLRIVPSHMSQVFQNLISNAIKYKSPERQLTMKIASEELPDAWCFTVSDNGLGIDSNKVDKIFQLFNQIDPVSEGVGIGLATCKQIVEMYSGKIWVESEFGQGSDFKFTMSKLKV